MPREATTVTVTVMILVLLGVLMVYSVCAVSEDLKSKPMIHLVYAMMGTVTMFVAARFDYHRLRDPLLFRCIVLASLALLALVLIPHFGIEVNNARRWLAFGGFRFQPSEFAKFALVLLLAVKLTDNEERIHTFFGGFLPPMLIAGLFAGMVLLENDLGVPAVMLGVSLIMFCIAGMRWRYLIVSVLSGIAAIGYLIQIAPHRAMRLTYFLDPWPFRDVRGGSYQLIQGLAAFAQGGLFGRGAGASLQKLYVPEAHNDFVFAPIGAEFGLAGTLAVVVLFAALCFAALRISMYAADRFGSLLAAGFGMLILLQAAFVMAVTTGIAPTKGLPLPFISYGGTALIVFMGLAGILVNIAAQAPDIEKKRRAAAA